MHSPISTSLHNEESVRDSRGSICQSNIGQHLLPAQNRTKNILWDKPLQNRFYIYETNKANNYGHFKHSNKFEINIKTYKYI